MALGTNSETCARRYSWAGWLFLLAGWIWAVVGLVNAFGSQPLLTLAIFVPLAMMHISCGVAFHCAAKKEGSN